MPRPRRPRHAAIALVSGIMALAMGGCGGARRLPPPCRAGALDAVARGLGVPSARVGVTVTVGNNGSPQCAYSAGRVRVLVNVDSGPQPYFILERTAVEARQQFSSGHNALTVVNVPHTGLDAFWFPSGSQFMTTDGVKLLTVTVTWSGSTDGTREALGLTAARPYLGKLVQPPGYQG